MSETVQLMKILAVCRVENLADRREERFAERECGPRKRGGRESSPSRLFRFDECIQPIDNHHVLILP
jgi:hypothetical protein